MVQVTRPAPPLWLGLAVFLPGAFAALTALVWLLSAATGVPTAASSRVLTLPEAMAIASHADVARLLRAGADPNAPASVRAGLVRNREVTATPLEAATAAIRTGPLEMLADAGAVIDERNYGRLWCSATARGNQDMLRFIAARLPADRRPNVDCGVTPSLW